MDGMSGSKKTLITLTFGLYIAYVGINILAARGGPDSALFPSSVANISKTFELEMTPVGKTFAIWGVIFTLQLVWLTYALTTTRRTTPSANILSKKVYVAFILNMASLTVWLLAWCRAEGVISFIATLVSQVFLNVAIAYSFIDLKRFLDENKGCRDGNADVWTQRILVQNALEFYATWTTVATMINFAIVLAYYMGLSTRLASIISLSVLGVITIVWFVEENTVLLDYTEYTCSVYVVLAIASSGIVANIFAADKVVGGIALSLVILSVIFLIIRVVVIVVHHNRKVRQYQSM